MSAGTCQDSEYRQLNDSQDFDEYSTFDGLNRLQTFGRGLLNGTKTGLSTENFANCWNLDSTGNWTGMKQADTDGLWTLEQARTANTVNEVTAISNTTGSSWSTPAYDPAGNMSTIPQPLAMGNTFTATWDAWNRLVKLVDGSDTVAEYAYDASRRRIVVKEYTSGTLSKTRHQYLSGGWQMLEERVDSGTTADQQFIWGLRYINDLVLRDRTVTYPLDERIYALQEVQWNVVALADTTGDVVERFAYQPYGVSEVLTSTFTSTTDSHVWQYRFTGRELDLDTGLDYFRNRYWHHLVGNFISRDPLEYVDGASLYAGYFVPRSMDPSGLYEWNIDESLCSITLLVKVRMQTPTGIEKPITAADFKKYKCEYEKQVESWWSPESCTTSIISTSNNCCKTGCTMYSIKQM